MDLNAHKNTILAALLEGRQAYINDYEEHGSCWIKHPAENIKESLRIFDYEWGTGEKSKTALPNALAEPRTAQNKNHE